MDTSTQPPSGLTPIWLISLALVLGTTIVVLIPAAIATGGPIKSSDWIGFAGNVVSGAMTIIAALIAWLAVQKQIEIQKLLSRQQAAIQKFNILQAQLVILQEENILADAMDLQSKYAQLTKKHYLNTLTFSPWQITGAKQNCEKQLIEINRIDEEFQRAGRNRSAYPAANKQRSFARLKFIALRGEIITLKGELSLIELRSQTAVSAADTAWLTSFDLSIHQKDSEDACQMYQSSVGEEIQRLNALVQEMRQEAQL